MDLFTVRFKMLGNKVMSSACVASRPNLTLSVTGRHILFCSEQAVAKGRIPRTQREKKKTNMHGKKRQQPHSLYGKPQNVGPSFCSVREKSSRERMTTVFSCGNLNEETEIF